jgi:hypothetical protein
MKKLCVYTTLHEKHLTLQNLKKCKTLNLIIVGKIYTLPHEMNALLSTSDFIIWIIMKM